MVPYSCSTRGHRLIMDKSELKLAAIITILLLPLVLVVFISFGQGGITSNEDFFVLSKGPTPQIDIDKWELEVLGMVENNLTLSYHNITSMDNKTVTALLKCVEGPWGRAEWRGVPLRDILALANVSEGAQEVVFHAADGYSSSITMEDAMNPDYLLAFEMNGETLPADHGYPLRLVAPGKYGYKWVKWIVSIEVVSEDHKGFWESRGWDDDADLSTFTDWGTHALLLSVGFVFGGLAMVSGYKGSRYGSLLKGLPEFVDRKFHKIMSYLYIVSLFGIFLYWAIVTYQNRGAVFYTVHGLLALSVILIHAFGGATGKWLKGKRMQDVHSNLNLFAFVLYTGAIITGVLRAYGTGL